MMVKAGKREKGMREKGKREQAKGKREKGKGVTAAAHFPEAATTN